MKLLSNKGKPCRLLKAALLIAGCAALATVSSASQSAENKHLKKVNDGSHLRPMISSPIERQASASSPLASAIRADKKLGESVSAQVSSAPGIANAAASVAAAQVAPEKKQADAELPNALAEEYVQIKPEEVGPNEPGKELLDFGTSSDSRAEHKSSSAADDELNAQLVQDIISQQESAAYEAYAMSSTGGVAPPVAAPRAAYVSGSRPHRPPMGRPRGPPAGRQPPSYVTLKGKLTGINSLISQYPHPAPGYPHQGPRHLPRGAAAGYAAFRDFVRAHASKYKHAAGGPIAPPAGLYQPPASHQLQAYLPYQQHSAEQAAPAYGGEQKDISGAGQYKKEPSGGEAGNGYAPSAGQYQQQQQQHQHSGPSTKTKVTVAQAYIPHSSSGQSAGNQYNSAYTNPILSKLYGNHAPQGVGKAEYSRDYGMVIHYPQATVYTEPMTVEQLHKLTGSGISQVIEQLQYNLANGHRDEQNTIRANNKHHLGNGVHIHAKEYYAPGKGGHYVPTTAAVISTSSGSNQAGYGAEQEAPAAAYNGANDAAALGAGAGAYQGPASLNQELGAGYERVKQAAAAAGGAEKHGSTRYEGKQSSSGSHQAPSSSYGGSEGKQSAGSYAGNGEPLTSITNLIGSELESLYKANAALTKHLGSEINAGIQAYQSSKSGYGKSTPLRYSELGHKSPFGAEAAISPLHPGGHRQKYGGQNDHQANRYAGGAGQHRPRGPRRQPHGSRHGNRYAPRPNHQTGPRQHQQSGRAYQQQQQQQQQQQHHHQQQQQAYQVAEQALKQQMQQLLQEFHSGDEQYNGKSAQVVNQGYPNKVMQKYQQSASNYGNGQQQQQQHSPMTAYGQLQEGLEIPQGPNDQVGEIADLIEALKGTLEMHQPEQAAGDYAPKNQHSSKSEDVKYLASALGQAPSYAMQVPVTQEAGYQANANANANGNANQQQQYYQQPQPLQQYQQPAIDQQVNGYQASNGYQQTGANEYGQQQQQQQQVATGQYSAPQVVSFQQQSQTSDYLVQQQQDFQKAQPQQAAEYGPSSGPQQLGYGGNALAATQISGAYPQSSGEQQQQQQLEHQQQQQPQTAYSTSEHSSVINHLVPVQQQTSGNAYAQSAFNAQSSHQSSQPANTIALAAPTESHYQQAQSLSSFVDSLPADYQELLRQPALIDGHSSAPHLAALGHEQSGAQSAGQASGYGTAAAASAPSATIISPSASAAHHSNANEASSKLSAESQINSLANQYELSAKGGQQALASPSSSSSSLASSSAASSSSSSLASSSSSSSSSPSVSSASSSSQATKGGNPGAEQYDIKK